MTIINSGWWGRLGPDVLNQREPVQFCFIFPFTKRQSLLYIFTVRKLYPYSNFEEVIHSKHNKTSQSLPTIQSPLSRSRSLRPSFISCILIHRTDSDDLESSSDWGTVSLRYFQERWLSRLCFYEKRNEGLLCSFVYSI